MSRGELWKHVPSKADVEYNLRETALALEKARPKWPGRPDCSIPLEFGYRWCERVRIPRELVFDELEWRDITIAKCDPDTGRFLVNGNSLADTRPIRVYRVPLAKPRAVHRHQGDRAQDVLDAMRPLGETIPKQLTAGIGRGAA